MLTKLGLSWASCCGKVALPCLVKSCCFTANTDSSVYSMRNERVCEIVLVQISQKVSTARIRGRSFPTPIFFLFSKTNSLERKALRSAKGGNSNIGLDNLFSSPLSELHF